MRKLLIFLLLCAPCYGQILSGILNSSTAAATTNYYYGYSNTALTGTTIAPTAGQHGASNFPVPDVYALADSFTTGTHTSAVACGAYFSAIDATNKHWKCAVFVDSGATIAQTPVTNCQTANTVISATGWNEVTMTGCTLSASTAYVLAVLVEGAGSTEAYDSSVGTGAYSNNFADYTAYPTMNGIWTIPWGSSVSAYVRMQ